ncbi:3'-5' exonuclease [Candidatus Saccharibacteria bacterium]|nr:3'-5' exonuclease [Candidatus Saccharibacteria bacterium]
MNQFAGFSKDILLIDFESTGFIRDPATKDVIDPGDPTQLGAVLLDKQSLKEKDSFLSDIKADPARLDPWVLEHTDITAERVLRAPTLQDIAQQFLNHFGSNIYLASWNVSFDRHWLNTLMQSINRRDSLYDYHHIDVWTLAYTYLCQNSRPEIIRSEDTFRAFGQSERSAHNALDDCRRTAEVLRAIINRKPLTP